MKVRPSHSDKARSSDGTKTVGQIAREEQVILDALPMVVRCCWEDCEWSFEGKAGEARDRARELREAEHPEIPEWVRGYTEKPSASNGDAGDAGREALDRMDAGEPQRPLGEGDPSVGEPDLESGGPAAGAGPTASSPSPSGRKVNTRESIIAEIQAFAGEHGRPPAGREPPSSRLQQAASRLGLSWPDLVEEAGFDRPSRGTRYAPLGAGPKAGATATKRPSDHPRPGPAPSGDAGSPRKNLIKILDELRNLVDLYFPEKR